ncbi:MAG: hypothetical protein WCK60_03325 [Candidatus Nomurabacteria bacterium]
MSWNDADESDKILYKALSSLYAHNENLLHLLLNPDCPSLMTSSDGLKLYCKALSSGEQVLLRIGLDIWDGSGGIHFNELYETLDDKNFQKMLQVLLFLRSPKEAILF